MKDTGTYLRIVAEAPSNRFENDLLDSNNTRNEFGWARHDKMFWHSDEWIYENVEIRQAHL
jgi:hypothetical protein